MSEQSDQKFLIRDAQGNTYGPADAAVLRDWVAQGRIVRGMQIAPRETMVWVEASQHPAIADLLGGAAASGLVVSQPVPGSAVQPISADAGLMTYETPNLAPRTGMAMWSMITGIVAPVASIMGCVPLCGCILMPIGTTLAITALVLGIISYLNQKKEPQKYGGRTFAIAGMSLGAATLLLMAMVFVGAFIVRMLGRP